MATKVDKVTGKQLSTNDYTTVEKTKLAGVETGANKYVLPVASATTSGGIKVGANLQMVDGVLNAVQGTIDVTPFETKVNAANTYVSKTSLTTTLTDYAKKSDISQAVIYLVVLMHLPTSCKPHRIKQATCTISLRQVAPMPTVLRLRLAIT